jgi:predicted ATPase
VKEELQFSGQPIFRFNLGEAYLYNDRLDGKAYVNYPFDWHRSALATITERKDNTKLSWFKRWMGGLLCLSPDPRRMSALAHKEAGVPAADLRNFADWYRHLRLENDDRALLNDLRDAIEGFEGMDLKDAGLGNRVLKLTLSSEQGPAGSKRKDSYGFEELSDGQRMLIGLYTVLHFAFQPDATIFLDEPDSFIALREVQPFLDRLLERVEEQNAQVLIISHHPELLNRMAFQDGLLLDRPGSRQTRVRRFVDPTATGLAPAELVARG